MEPIHARPLVPSLRAPQTRVGAAIAAPSLSSTSHFIRATYFFFVACDAITSGAIFVYVAAGTIFLLFSCVLFA